MSNPKPAADAHLQPSPTDGENFEAECEKLETSVRIKLLWEMEPVKVFPTAQIPSERELKTLFSTFGEIKNSRDGITAFLPNRTVGKILRHKGFNVGRIAQNLPEIFSASVPAWSEAYQAKLGHKDHSTNIKAYHNYIGKFASGEKFFFIRFTLHEENKRGGNGRKNLHSTFISDTGLYRQSKGAEFSRVHVSNMGVEKSAPSDLKLAQWLGSVNFKGVKIPPACCANQTI